MELPDDELLAAIDRVLASTPADLDAQVEREITRYWNDRIKKADQASQKWRQIRILIHSSGSVVKKAP